MQLIILVFNRPNLFAVNENLYHLLGLGELKNLFNIPDYKTKQKVLQLYYPERFLNLIEQRVVVERCKFAGYEEVHITTCSPFIIQTVDHKSIQVVQDENIPEDGRFKLSNDFSGLPDDNGLGVF